MFKPSARNAGTSLIQGQHAHDVVGNPSHVLLWIHLLLQASSSLSAPQPTSNDLQRQAGLGSRIVPLVQTEVLEEGQHDSERSTDAISPVIASCAERGWTFTSKKRRGFRGPGRGLYLHQSSY
ncbi:uncharacterized protein CLUP02_06881 [Colletotrichum lupini]|uniref:Uncharacterized protein n=1 Tax=Colletotrichum lupini TaxID=145971 RepID=A0A9Q8WG56_9PEZI|nr:uncharacterized protein CLUP02_06881 [Colletotrichum lupini]UQC81395.1 hypothetical protein CLUP02_06881 [Colletotrichum lupini]